MSEEWKEKLAKGFGRPLPKDKGYGEKEYIKKDKDNPKPKRKHGDKDMPPNRFLPLYDSLKQEGTTARKMGQTGHAGLLFDKFCDVWSGSEKKWKPETPKNKPSVKQEFMTAIVNQLKNNNVCATVLKQYHERREALLSAIEGESCNFTTQWRFVSGLGMGHVLETGFVWHRILGVPYLPGSSVKGLIRAWVDPKTDKETGKHLGLGDPVRWEKEYKKLFGDEKDLGAGNLIVFDAIPETKPILELDIMNPHYGDYYSKKPMKILVNGKEQKIDTPPADYLSPNPIFFLTVASNMPFKFALAPRPGKGTVDDLINGFVLLREALDNIGAGAKTAVGYGYFTTELT